MAHDSAFKISGEGLRADRCFQTCHLFFVLGQLHVDVAGVFLDAVCTADEAVEMVPHEVLKLACLKPSRVGRGSRETGCQPLCQCFRNVQHRNKNRHVARQSAFRRPHQRYISLGDVKTPNLVCFSTVQTLEAVADVVERRGSVDDGHEQSRVEVFHGRNHGATASSIAKRSGANEPLIEHRWACHNGFEKYRLTQSLDKLEQIQVQAEERKKMRGEDRSNEDVQYHTLLLVQLAWFRVWSPSRHLASLHPCCFALVPVYAAHAPFRTAFS